MLRSPYGSGNVCAAKHGGQLCRSRSSPRLGEDVNFLSSPWTAIADPISCLSGSHSCLRNVATTHRSAMDDWGDPWADDAEKSNTATKQELWTDTKRELGTSTRTALGILGGFQDEAGWGDGEEEDGFGGWADALPEAGDDTPTAIEEQATHYGDTSEVEDEPRKESELSIDSSTASTSPSDIAHLDGSHETPRTSFEDEAAISSKPCVEIKADIENSPSRTSHTGSNDGDLGNFNSFEDVVTGGDQLSKPPAAEPQSRNHNEEEPDLRSESTEALQVQKADVQSHSVNRSSCEPLGFEPDLSLLDQLCPLPGFRDDLPEVDDSLLSATSVRKAWYRITRKETMREFNSGLDNDTHVRVTWAGSAVQAEVNKVMGRWALEDRIHGKATLNGGTGATFRWEETIARAPLRPQAGIDRSGDRLSGPSTSGVSPSVTPAKQRPRSIAISTMRRASLVDDAPIVKFGWSSSPIAVDRVSEAATPAQEPPSIKANTSATMERGGPREQDASTSASQPLPAQPRSIESPRPSESKPDQDIVDTDSISVLSGVVSEPADVISSHDTAVYLDSVTNPPDLGAEAPPSPAVAADAFMGHGIDDPWASPAQADTAAPFPSTPEAIADTEDDWGEMIQSPPTPQQQQYSTSYTSHGSKLLLSRTPDLSLAVPSADIEYPTSIRSDPIALQTTSAAASLSPVQQQPTPNPLSMTDLSIFDSSPQNPPGKSRAVAAQPKHQRASSATVNYPHSAGNSSRPVSLPPIRNATMSSTQKSQEAKRNEEPDAAVREILDGLPDLRYMLR